MKILYLVLGDFREDNRQEILFHSFIKPRAYEFARDYMLEVNVPKDGDWSLALISKELHDRMIADSVVQTAESFYDWYGCMWLEYPTILELEISTWED